MKYPLQKEIEQDMKDAFDLFNKASMDYNSLELLNKLTKEIASKYYNAIKRINDICVNRNRY